MFMYNILNNLINKIDMDLFLEFKLLAQRLFEGTDIDIQLTQTNELRQILQTLLKKEVLGNINEININSKIIIYGAGLRGKETVPVLLGMGFTISQIWDKFETGEICKIKITRPDFNLLSDKSSVVVCIQNHKIANDVIKQLKDYGAGFVCSYHQFLVSLEFNQHFDHPSVNDDVIKTIQKNIPTLNIISIDDITVPVLFEKIYHVENKTISIKRSNKDLYDVIQTEVSISKLSQMNYDEIRSHASNLTNSSNMHEALIRTEILLRCLFLHDVKSKKFSLKIDDPAPYDTYTLYVIIRIVCNYIFQNSNECTVFLKNILFLAQGSYVPLLCLLAEEFVHQGNHDQALKIIRKARFYEPKSLLADDVFIEIAEYITLNGGVVDENGIDFHTFKKSLSGMYCKSGLTFATILAIDDTTGKAIFSGCFREIKCTSALTQSQFWTSEEWKEFRRSVTDGSFRYCLKTDCANLVGGWLPKKEREFTEVEINSPLLTELHLSYDRHCPLQCYSCRKAVCLNSDTKKHELNKMFHQDIEPLLDQLEHLTLSGCGEAIVSPHSIYLLKNISRLKYPKLLIELRTNGVCFSRKAWENIGTGKECIKHVTFSVDAADAETFERLRSPAKWAVMQKNLKFVSELRTTNEIELLEFGVVIQRDNLYQLRDIIELAIKYEADVISFYQMNNWNRFSPEEHHDLNVCRPDNELYPEYRRVVKEIRSLRNEINSGSSPHISSTGKKIKISMYFEQDGDDCELHKLHESFKLR